MMEAESVQSAVYALECPTVLLFSRLTIVQLKKNDNISERKKEEISTMACHPFYFLGEVIRSQELCILKTLTCLRNI